MKSLLCCIIEIELIILCYVYMVLYIFLILIVYLLFQLIFPELT